ncbi:MAG: hypothetical protein COA97_05755 [Flavobacteriales bacterium]|nr:MAG: hypothetical protein COA97_05755 [Flavobacteriales bacterium]
MKKDIKPSKVKDVAVAVIKEQNELGQDIWNVYLINQKTETIENVLVSAKGYLTDVKGIETKTSSLRHSIGNIEANNYAQIEPIMEDVFGLHNEYWISFFHNNEMLDKKYIFLAETIAAKNLINVPIINKSGVMIK